MTSLQRINVINGRPTLDAQGMVSLVRRAGHSLIGGSDESRAEVVGVRRDTGDTMKVTFTIEDAKRAGLVRSNSPWTKFPKSMLWARAVSQLARELFADVLLGMSYVPEEMEAVTGVAYGKSLRAATVVDDTEDVDFDTGEILGIEVVPDTLNKGVSERDISQAKDGLRQIIQEVVPEDQRMALRGYLTEKYGAASDLSLEQIEEATTIAAGWPATAAQEPLWTDEEPF
jgi:hypothetical protein